MSNFLELVAKERTRQIVEKGYTAKHDGEYTDGALADAGACYAENEKICFHRIWPFGSAYFNKDKYDRKQQLIIAAAFINAEYDRIVRAEQKTKKDFMDSIDEMYD